MRIHRKTPCLLVVATTGILSGPAPVTGSAALHEKVPTRILVLEQEGSEAAQGGSELAPIVRYGKDLSLKVCVRAGSSRPQGEVVLFLDRTRRGTAILPYDGCVGFSIAQDLDVGEHTLRTTYSGSLEHAPTDDARTLTVERDLPWVVFERRPTASENLTYFDPDAPVRVEDPVTYVVTVAPCCFEPENTSRIPTGTVTITEGDRVVDTVGLVEGQATVTFTGLSVGTHHFTAAYSGDRWFVDKSEDDWCPGCLGTGGTLLIVHDGAYPLVLYTFGPEAVSGGTVSLRTQQVGSVEGMVRTRLVDTRTGTVIATDECAEGCQWEVTRADARYDLQAQAVDASGRVLYRSQVHTVSWTPPTVELTASTRTPPAGSPAVLTVTVREKLFFDNDDYMIRIVEFGSGSVLADCPSSQEECSVPLVRSAGTSGFVGQVVYRPTGAILTESASVQIDWK
ncbi:MAG: hypothetical protein QG608_193 [Actinomycetota bacterium]|nr:hypothetical protein [Actinomycetota bacterium]